MKNMKKNDGYIMVYVLVVVLVVSMVAVAACTAAIRNFKSQSAAVNYTQDKYAAQGVVERFVAELKDAAVEVAEDVAANHVDTAKNVEQELKDGIDAALLGSGENKGVIDTVKESGLIDVSGTMHGFKNYTYTEKDDMGAEHVLMDSDQGFYRMELKISTSYGSVELHTDLDVVFSADVISSGEGINSAELYRISGVSFRYTSYEVTPTTGR